MAAKIALIKKNYYVLFACGKRLAYLENFDVGEVYLYWAARNAMRNADWYFIVNVSKYLVTMRRYSSAAKWLERAGYFARKRNSPHGMYAISNVYKLMGYKYKKKQDYWFDAARNLEKKLSGIQY